MQNLEIFQISLENFTNLNCDTDINCNNIHNYIIITIKIINDVFCEYFLVNHLQQPGILIVP